MPESKDTANESPEARTQAVIDRRSALRAALGGAVAAAVFVGPKVEGFSIAPDYAAAASCVSGSQAISHTTPCIYCLGNGCAGSCGTWNSGPVQITNNNTGTVLYATVTLNGATNGDGQTKVDVNGITSNAFENCTVKSNSVNQTGSCGGWDTSSYSMVRVNNVGLSNLTKTWATHCNARVANMTIWTTVTCTCS